MFLAGLPESFQEFIGLLFRVGLGDPAALQWRRFNWDFHFLKNSRSSWKMKNIVVVRHECEPGDTCLLQAHQQHAGLGDSESGSRGLRQGVVTLLCGHVHFVNFHLYGRRW
jgi:hypothetical protein